VPSKFSNQRKSSLLGMPLGTAGGKLRKAIMFDLVRKCGQSACYRCGKEILTCDELSIEHKNGWQLSDDPAGAYFDLENIGFSHLICNIKAGARPGKIYKSKAEARYVHSRKPLALAKKKISNAARVRRKDNADAGLV
jgi:hypothetical protein